MCKSLVPLAFVTSTTTILSGCADVSVSFNKDVQPILDTHCAECHTGAGEGVVASGFVVESYDTVMKGTKLGPVVVAGDPLSSNLYRMVSGKVDKSIQMPHGKNALENNEIITIEAWIQQGAANN